jgi:hypothetical protein
MVPRAQIAGLRQVSGDGLPQFVGAQLRQLVVGFQLVGLVPQKVDVNASGVEAA